MTTRGEDSAMTENREAAGSEDDARRRLRRAYREKREAQLRELTARLDLLEAKKDRAKADARIRYEEELEKIRQKLDSAREKLSILQDAGEQAWEDVKAGLDAAVRDVRQALRRAASRFE